MDRNDLDDISRALRLLISAQSRNDLGDTRVADDESREARKRLHAVLARNGRNVKAATDPAALEARRARMVRQLESGLAGAAS